MGGRLTHKSVRDSYKQRCTRPSGIVHFYQAPLLLLLPLYTRLTMPSSQLPAPPHHEHPEVPVQQLLVFPSGKDGCALGALGIGSSEMGKSIPLGFRTTWIA